MAQAEEGSSQTFKNGQGDPRDTRLRHSAIAWETENPWNATLFVVFESTSKFCSAFSAPIETSCTLSAYAHRSLWPMSGFYAARGRNERLCDFVSVISFSALSLFSQKIACIGRPNAGKSTLINVLCGRSTRIGVRYTVAMRKRERERSIRHSVRCLEDAAG